MNILKKFILNKFCKLDETELVMSDDAQTLMKLVLRLINSVTKASWMDVDAVVLYDKYSLHYRNHQLRRCAVYNRIGWWKWLFKNDIVLPDFDNRYSVFRSKVITTQGINIERKDKAMAIIFGTNLIPKIHTKTEPTGGRMGRMAVTFNGKAFEDIMICADENTTPESIQEFVTNKLSEIAAREETANPLP